MAKKQDQQTQQTMEDFLLAQPQKKEIDHEFNELNE